MGSGTVKYPYYKTDGKVKFKGLRNKRSTKMRIKKEAADRAKQARQIEQDELEGAYSEEWDSYQG